MAATQGFKGYVKVGTAPTPTNSVSGLTDISTPWTRAQYDTTDMDNDANLGWMRSIPGLGSGKMALKANYLPSDTNGQAVLNTAFVNGTLLYFIASENGINTATFQGYVDSFQPHAPVNNKADVSYGITVDGAPTFA